MSSTFSRGVAAVLTASAIAGGGRLAAAPASAAPVKSSVKTTCTVTSAQRTADLDQLRTLSQQLLGRKLTSTERKAYIDAVAELVKTARDANMPAAERTAKLAELKALATKLRAAKTAEERTAVRAEIRAILLQLDAAKLTKAQRTELAAKITELSRTMRGAVTGADRAAVIAQLKALTPNLRCKVVG
jgi:hypothetical protein